jgi:hypothetical protein
VWRETHVSSPNDLISMMSSLNPRTTQWRSMACKHMFCNCRQLRQSNDKRRSRFFRFYPTCVCVAAPSTNRFDIYTQIMFHLLKSHGRHGIILSGFRFGQNCTLYSACYIQTKTPAGNSLIFVTSTQSAAAHLILSLLEAQESQSQICCQACLPE